jgi:hypothetical protein
MVDAFSGLYNIVAGLFNKLFEAMTKPIVKVVEFIGEMIGKVAKMVADHPSIAKMMGMDADTVKGLQDAAASVKDMATNIKPLQLEMRATDSAEKVKAEGPQYKAFAAMGQVESLASRQDKEFAKIEVAKQARLAAAAAEKAAAEAKTKQTPAVALPAHAGGMTMPNLSGGMPPPEAGMPAGDLAQFTTAGGKPEIAEINTQMLEAINHPAWTADYMALLQKQHAEMMGALGALAASSPKTGTKTALPTPVAVAANAGPTAPPATPGRRT